MNIRENLQAAARRHFAEQEERKASRIAQRKNYKVNKEEARRKYLLTKYGITPEEYDRMFAEQGGKCAICDRPEKDGVRLAVDHHHGSGKIRQLLCGGCNRGLGDFKEDRYLLTAAIEYLTKHQ